MSELGQCHEMGNPLELSQSCKDLTFR